MTMRNWLGLTCRKRLFLSFAVLACFLLFMTNQKSYKYLFSKDALNVQPIQIGSSSHCQLPLLNLKDPEIDHFFMPATPLRCSLEEPNWVYTNGSKFYTDEAAIRKYGPITCNYSSIVRVSDFKIAKSGVHQNFSSGSPLLGDFFSVSCKNEGQPHATYSNVHISVVPSNEALERSKEAKDKKRNGLDLNVYMLGFDSISRMTFMRKMPKAYEYITKVKKGIVLEGYNIVGDGTPQALIPILTGKTEPELPLTRKRYSNASYVNVYPFVWNEFRDAGYATMYGEDSPHVGTFTYRLKGFDQQPTDHYMLPFYLAAHHQRRKHAKWCWGYVPHHKVHFSYAEDMFKNYPLSVRKFAFLFHSVLSHDDINAIEVADEDLRKHLQFFDDTGHFNDTVIIIMADHGHRFAKLRETQQGKLEERLPFFAFIFPPWFEVAYPKVVENFRLNAKRLTTPFDIHETFESMLHFKYPPKKGNAKQRGISLFDEVPFRRTCKDADIEMHWCTCLSWITVDVTDVRVHLIAETLVQTINNETERERQLCSPLQLEKIEKALNYKPNRDLLAFKASKDADGFEADLSGTSDFFIEYYQVNIRTTPGGALYEASVSYNIKLDTVTVNLQDVSHINQYGDLPHCIIDKDYFLAKWCVCYDKISPS